MSSPNLPAGFSITTIDGQRCTAVPRSLTTLTGSLVTAAAAQPPTTTTEVVASTTPVVVPTTLATSVVQNTIEDTNPPAATSSTPVVSVASTPGSSAILPAIVTTPVQSPVSSATIVTSAIAASKSTTPTTSSSTPLAVAQSEVHASATAVTGENNGVDSSIPSGTTSSPPILATSSTQPEESSAASGISSQPKLTTGPVIGGVLGSMGFIAVVALLFWFFRRKRKARESLLTPLTTGRRSSFYDADNQSVGPSGQGNKWRTEIGYRTDRVRNVGSDIKAGIVAVGASLKSKVVRERSDTPSVNLNRGNSQFLDGPIPQHSRNNSTLSNPTHVTIKEKATDWWERLRENMTFGWAKKSEPADPFAAARGMTEKRAIANGSPDFSQLLGMDDRDLQIQAERRRASLAGNTGSLPQLGSLGLNFNTTEDPFADPKKPTTTTSNNSTPGWKPPNANPKTNPFADPTPRSNPFADPVSRPDPTIPKSNTYIADIRRSRGQSIDANTSANNATAATSLYRPPSTATAIQSRYPSSLAPSRDSYRDTVFSSFSANVRKGKGRSDPFDLERPELWKPRDSNLYPNPLNGIKEATSGSSAYAQNQRIISNATYTSKYSSGVSSLGEWGDPGPDLGPSQNSSLRGNASSNGGSGDYTSGKPGLEEMVRDGGEVSRQSSKASSKNGVGKAM
ncbi:hypothetical protein ACEPPN_007912 [Leptodophora sp. 'Broadleaf-Isolate-01']